MEPVCSPAAALSGLVGSIVLIIVLLRLRFDLGLSLFAGAALIGLLSGLGIQKVFITLVLACIKASTVRLVVVILLIMLLAQLASQYRYLETFTRALERLISDRRVSMCLIPAFGGLLPMPGGAMWSAPLVQTIAGKMDISPEQRTFVNYWFRHVWEFVLPVYPGLLLASVVLGFPLERVVSAQAPLCGASILGGAVVVFMRIKRGGETSSEKRDFVREMMRLLSGIWPFALVIIPVLAFRADLLVILVVAILIMALVNRASLTDLKAGARAALSPAIISLVLGVMAFKDVMEAGGVVEVLPGVLGSLHVPNVLVLFLVPMVIGLLTGITQAFVGAAFPVVLAFINAASFPPAAAAVAYAGGFIGVLLSPVHLCLVLTRQYFGARLGGVYRLMIVPCLFIAAVAFLLSFR